ncbi:MAG: hypothetical protein Q9196_007143 [Gyalolechia fulgens]
MPTAIDLAGSEDNRRTDNGKDRLVESASINKSLFVLAKCVEAISQNQARIPYRESKMTRILSLGQNNGLTVMILNLAPSRSYHLDTISSLNFANRTKTIETREIENEPITKGCSRAVPAATGLSMQRQPLRPLASTAHNTAVGAKSVSQKGVKSAKSFSVYTDKSRSSSTSTHITKDMPNRFSPLKRPSDAGLSAFGRPAKRRSPDRTNRPSASISKAAIEDMIEKKVTDILAVRALDQTSAASVPEISDEVQRRLALLEQKVDNQDDSRDQGLSFLLMAKQHAVRGEDKSALRMFLLARVYFPDNAKLKLKIERLQKKLQETVVADGRDSGAITETDVSRGATRHTETAFEIKDSKKDNGRRGRRGVDDEDYTGPDEVSEAACDSDDSFRCRPRTKKPPPKPATNSISYDEGTSHANTPRTKRLLEIVNSQDIRRLRLLRGVGTKKAEAMIEALSSGEDGDDKGPVVVHSLAQLGQLRGVGVRTVENMRSGLEVERL